KCYKQKQYKNGLKFCKMNLSNPEFAEHGGNVLPVERLTLNSEYYSRGLQLAAESIKVWHFSQEFYSRLLLLSGIGKCYRLLQLRPTQRASRIGCAVADHLLKGYDMALKLLEEFRQTQQDHCACLWCGVCVPVCLYVCVCYWGLNHRAFVLIDSPSPLGNFEIWCVIEGLVNCVVIPSNSEKFRELMDKFLKANFNTGCPPLFTALKSLYYDAEKVSIIQELVANYEASLKTCDFVSPCGKNPQQLYFQVQYFLAQYLDKLEQYSLALEYINSAIASTPTLIELFYMKAKIYKHMGHLKEAAQWMDGAQSLNTADRFIDSKCAEYVLQVNMIKEAEEMCSKFTREGISAVENLREVQSVWFQTECISAYQLLGRYRDALKNHFVEITEDQFDFHTCCMRKMILCACVDLLRLEDMIEVYLKLYDNPLTNERKQQEINSENLPAKELKKMLSKQRRAHKKAKLEEKTKHAEREHQQKSQKKKRDDEEESSGLKEELVPEKLERFLTPLMNLVAGNTDTHLLAFEIYFRKGKFLLMLQSVKRAFAISSNNPWLHECLVRFSKSVSVQSNLQDIVSKVLPQEMQKRKIFVNRDLESFSEDFLKYNTTSLQHLLSGAKMMYFLDKSRQEKAVAIATGLDETIKDESVE
uniref:N-alpha-acetyltransferase 16, NatA auxiliary subunit n=1 Tax=Chinchilla lanigera TaxID=34839 RepID=A0A8C2UMN1_CHILA